MKFLKGLNKLIEGTLLLIVPVVVFYWFLLVINLEVLNPFAATLGGIFNQYIDIVRSVVHYEIPYNEGIIDFTPLIFAGCVLAVSFIFAGIGNILNSVEQIFVKAKLVAKEKEDKKLAEQSKVKFLEMLAKNKVVYLVLKLRKKASKSSYLFEVDSENQGNDQFTPIFDDVLDSAQSFKAKKYENNYDEDENTYFFLFYNVTDAIDYSFSVLNKIQQADKELVKIGSRVSASISCHCGLNENNSTFDFPTTLRILSLCGEQEIVTSELFKNKYEALKAESNLVFDSKGIYNIENKQMEIYALRIRNLF